MWRGGRFKRDICICIADPHCCTAETNTTLERNYTPIKKKKKDLVGVLYVRVERMLESQRAESHWCISSMEGINVL